MRPPVRPAAAPAGPAPDPAPVVTRPPLTRLELRQREQQRLDRLRSLEERIGDALRTSQASGELERAPSWGRPLRADDGFEQTPVELRLPFKILKDAGVVPPEVEMMQRIGALQRELDAATDDAARRALQQRVAELRQLLAMRLERLRVTGRL